jgi:hypothetical protein
MALSELMVPAIASARNAVTEPIQPTDVITWIVSVNRRAEGDIKAASPWYFGTVRLICPEKSRGAGMNGRVPERGMRSMGR